MGEGVDSLLQVVILRVQQRRLLSLKGAVGVGVLSELADHGELWETKPGHVRKSIIQPVFLSFSRFCSLPVLPDYYALSHSNFWSGPDFPQSDQN